MNLFNGLYKLLANDSIHLKSKEPDVRQWERFLNSQPVMNDAVECAYNKFLCWQYFFSPRKVLLLKGVGFFCMLIELPLLLVSLQKRKSIVRDLLVIEKHSEVDYEDVIPQEFFNAFEKIEIIENINKKFGFITKESRKYLLTCIRRHPTDFFFQYFVCKELIAHDYIIRKFVPQATAVYVNERNVATPILKKLYEENNRKLLSFMHGEYLLNLIQAYMSFSDYYVWDESYIDNFKNFLRCDIDNYHVYTPKKLEKKWNLEQVCPKYQLTYYFSNDSFEVIEIIAKVFSALQKKSVNCKVRPHPRFIQKVLDRSDLFKNIFIENPSVVSLEKSLGDTEFAVGLFSTVLFEAKVEGRSVIIDDISDRKSFVNLKNRRARLLTQEFRLLSSVLTSYGVDCSEWEPVEKQERN